MKLADGTLDPRKNDLKSLLKQYTIREVALVSSFSFLPRPILLYMMFSMD